ncbi:NUC153 domain protein [Oesophagostomum dentatum]|uniref:NUC153 domain protein n=1 Tax=Oesophagostomum dentatum TaxID=61180 RepID=A0A0B1SNT7_OESDE|nr:NUC153 domain protein [Oesophagostomum dentatum]
MEIDLAHLDRDAEQVEWATNRIAACNMDWNLVRCEDLMVLCQSFTYPLFYKMPKKKGSKLLGLEDERFAHLRSDPKFSGLSNKEKKVTIGKRFAAAVTDPRFSSRARVDKYGRPVKRAGGELLDLYELEGSDEEEHETEESTPKKARVESKSKKEHVVDEDEEKEESEGSAESDDDDEPDSDDNHPPAKLDLARGEGNVESSSDDESDADSEDLPEFSEDLQMEIDLAHLDRDAEQVEWATNRIAACNMDWNLVHCEDLMVLCQSFTPPGGVVKRITIYLSDFGAERLAEEDKHGPRLQLSKPLEEYDGDKLDDETKLAMRKYQVDQLRYYYAIIECDTMETAVSIYDQCDGYQFEASNIKMDLRFVPEGMEFDKDRIKEEITDEDLNVAKYKSKERLKSAVTLTSARIGWDENEELRQRKFEEAFNSDEEAGADLIADSESDDEEREKNRQALLSLLGKNDEVEGLQKNTYQAYLERRKRKKAERKQKIKEMKEKEREALKAVEDQAKAKKKENRAALKASKEKEEKEGTLAEVVAKDERFKALFTDSAFAIDQSSKNYKGSKLIEKQVSAKRQAREQKHKDASTGESDLVTKLKNKSTKWKKKNT